MVEEGKTVILKAADLDGYLSDADKENLGRMNEMYDRAISYFDIIDKTDNVKRLDEAKRELISIYDQMGKQMQSLVAQEPDIHVYSFDTPKEVHGEASRLISKLRNVRTQHHEFVYYIQRAYELLFNLAFTETADRKSTRLNSSHYS